MKVSKAFDFWRTKRRGFQIVASGFLPNWHFGGKTCARFQR
jgi:hypothetical protein